MCMIFHKMQTIRSKSRFNCMNACTQLSSNCCIKIGTCPTRLRSDSQLILAWSFLRYNLSCLVQKKIDKGNPLTARSNYFSLVLIHLLIVCFLKYKYGRHICSQIVLYLKKKNEYTQGYCSLNTILSIPLITL